MKEIYEWYDSGGLRHLVLVDDIVGMYESASVLMTKDCKIVLKTKHTIRQDIEYSDIDTMKEEFEYIRGLIIKTSSPS